MATASGVRLAHPSMSWCRHSGRDMLLSWSEGLSGDITIFPFYRFCTSSSGSRALLYCSLRLSGPYLPELPVQFPARLLAQHPAAPRMPRIFMRVFLSSSPMSVVGWQPHWCCTCHALLACRSRYSVPVCARCTENCTQVCQEKRIRVPCQPLLQCVQGGRSPRTGRACLPRA